MSRFTTTFALAAVFARFVAASPIPVAAPQESAPWQTASWQSAPWQTASWQSAPWQTAAAQTAPGDMAAAPTASAPATTQAPESAPAAAIMVHENAVVTQVVTEVNVAIVTDNVYTTVYADAAQSPAPVVPASSLPNLWIPSSAPNPWIPSSPAPEAEAPETTLTTAPAPAPETTMTTAPAPVTTSTTSTTPAPAPTSTSVYVAPAPESTSTSTTSVYTPPAAPASSSAAAPQSSSGTSSSSQSSGQTYSGIATVNPNPTNALGSCGGSTGDATFTVALSPSWIKSWNSPLCGSQIRLTNTGPSTDNSIGGKGNSVTVTVMDTCEGCDSTHLDLSTAAWNQLTNTADASQVSISWEFI